jgi:FkbM family methyltransferase
MLKRIVRGGLNAIGLDKLRPQLSEHAHLFEALLCSRTPPPEFGPFLKYCAQNMDRSCAQRFQDLLVLFLLNEKRNGYFVEFGALDGITFSNTALLERDYEWRGILAEPAKRFHQILQQNRTCAIDHRCVWTKRDAVLFQEAEEGTSSVTSAPSGRGERYMVETVSLSDLLGEHSAPKKIDYLSIDTEGSEFTILSSFFPTHYDIRVITIEHNFAPQRERIYNLLTAHGYKRTFAEFSKWDDWYLRSV